MPIYEIYSKRQMRLRGEFNDVYQYDDVPTKLRVQICKIYNSYFDCNAYQTNIICEEIYEILTTEYGVDGLKYNAHDISSYDRIRSPQSQKLLSFTKRESVTDCFLDVLELFVFFINEKQKLGVFSNLELDGIIDEINIRFRESAVGYQLDKNSLTVMRVDSQFVHSEIVKPTLTLLNTEQAYAGALDEFMLAHEHYRHRNYKDAILNCGKSFESMLKAIHEKHDWAYEKSKDTASKLIGSCVKNGLLPSFHHDQLTQVSKLLECGVPTVRNKIAGHGQGPEITEVPEYLVSYMIHLTASNLLFLAKANEDLSK